MKELKIVLPAGTKHILAAVSGGADSVAMLALLRSAAREAGVLLSAAHFEHGIRGQASREDADFVRELCREWRVPLLEGAADVPAIARARSIGLEQAAREARYAFLRESKAQINADLIALAHHQDDQAETVLMHLLRGSGLRGAAGMSRLMGDLYRPLLNVPKETLVCFLQSEGIPWREDATNRETDNPRNALRWQVLPQAERFYPGAGRALCRFAAIAERENDYMEAETDRFLSENAVEIPGGWALLMEHTVHPALLSRAIHGLTHIEGEAVDRVMALCLASKGTIELSGSRRAERGRRWLYLTDGSWKGLSARPLPQEGRLSLDGLGTLVISSGSGRPIRDDPFCQELDSDALAGAQVRTRRAGDFIAPLGAGGRKLLSDYFIDRHVDRAVRDMVPLVACGSQVLWVMGYGISQAAKLREGSRATRLSLEHCLIHKLCGRK